MRSAWRVTTVTHKRNPHNKARENETKQFDAYRWNAAEQVTAVAHDNPIPGFGTRNTINLRLWAAKPDKEFDLEAFNTGDYVQVHPPTSVIFTFLDVAPSSFKLLTMILLCLAATCPSLPRIHPLQCSWYWHSRSIYVAAVLLCKAW